MTVNKENIIKDYQFNFEKMPVEKWSNYGQIYDLKSVMHYDGSLFRTTEAADAGKWSIVYKGTDEKVQANAPELRCSF